MIQGNNAALFYERVGFSLLGKQERSALLPTKYNTNRDIIPFIGSKLEGYRYKSENRNPSYTTLQSVVDTYPKNRELPIVAWSLDHHPYWAKVASIENSYAQVFDLTVPDGNAFVANGVLCHNTWALRGLIWEWRNWADFHYIVDPDKFFGDQAGYMTRVLFSDQTHDEAGEERWKVLILEDCGEMLSKDARERSGQGLSRLLNLVDGLIGQGLRVLVLVTTNEELGALHDAISRPGRCACNLEFKPLRGIHLEQWLQKHGLDRELFNEATLAELFAAAAGRDTKSHRLAGFAA